MAAVNYLAIRDVAMHALVKREKSWPAKNPGVMVVFCVVFVVAVGLLGVFISKKLSARKAAKSTV
ncbi:hypothetical protein PT974_11547 [Cladobotryum mycophilum]|uniref:Uncharacterized protein n=1 Tax=Cladobotryum mycophilum TaxID=491253 RepID=A0ABR0S6J8_9HYPO